MPKSFLRQFVFATLAMALALLANAGAAGLAGALGFSADAQRLADQFGISLVWLTGAHMFNVLAGRLFWDGLVARALRRSPPRLIIQLMNLIVLLLALSGIVGIVFEQPITGLWATSGAIGVVIGLALRNLILDTFSGLAIHLEQPFKVGDWVVVQSRDGRHSGRIEETNWRSTRLLTAENNVQIIPNSLITSSVLTNCSMPESTSDFELSLVLDFKVQVERAMRVLGAAVRQATDENGVLGKSVPKVRVSATKAEGIEYTITYSIRPNEVRISAARDILLRRVLAHLASAGISLSYPRRDLFLARMPWRQRDWVHHKDIVRQLAKLSLFASLKPEELERLAAGVVVYPLASNETVVTQGEQGDSMFILAEGLLNVAVEQADGKTLQVGEIGPGQFFGERSLLTGEPRSATVSCAADSMVVEITKEALTDLLQANQELAQAFSRATLQRELNNGQALALSEQRQLEARINVEAGAFSRRLKTFFGLN